MNPPPGWYSTPDGSMRYWDGSQWTEPLVSLAPGGGPGQVDRPGSPGGPGGVPPTTQGGRPLAWFGWGGLLLMATLGAAISGLSALAMLTGMYVLVVGVVALIRGRVQWARIHSRRAGGVVIAAAIALLAVGGQTAPPTTGDPSPLAASHLPPPVTASPTPPPVTVTSTPAAARPARPSTQPTSPPPRTTTSPTTKPVSRPSAPARAAAGTALAAVRDLTVGGRAAKTGYDRDLFGQEWFDADRNGCDTRNDILRRDLTVRIMKNSCKVLAGALAPDPYTGATIRFIYGGASEVDIDHVVALSDAWQKSASTWTAGKRLALANDPLNLLAVDAGANRAKGDGDTATWLPPNKAYRCAYVARQVAVKRKYHLRVTVAEQAAMTRVLSNCPTMALPGPGSAPTVAALPRTRRQPSPAPPAPVPQPAKPAPAPAPAKPVPPPVVYYQNCTAVRAAGMAPLLRGAPGYSRKLDRDGDGVACE